MKRYVERRAASAALALCIAAMPCMQSQRGMARAEAVPADELLSNEQQGSLGVCYRVTGGESEMFLLGSIHIGSGEMYPFGAKIMDALNRADTLVFECDTTGGEVARQTAAMMRYDSGETLCAHVSPECYELVERVAQQTGYSLAALDGMRPWAATSMLSVKSTAAELGMADAAAALALGVEAQVRLLTADEGKQVAYLETAAEQLQTLDGLSPALQEYMLLTTCRTILEPETATGLDAGIANWPDWWRRGDAEAFANAYLTGMLEDPEPGLIGEYHAALVTRRNAAMTKKLCEMLQSGEKHSYLVTVGLMHLVLPDDSLVSELEKAGYAVERVL